MDAIFRDAREASRAINRLTAAQKDEVIIAVADAVEADIPHIIAQNELDMSAMDLADPMRDRLLLTPDRIKAIAADMRHVATLPSPLGTILSETVRPNGMKITKVSVPFGVIGVIYEARPNVTLDVFSLCFKSGNASILKGGSNARHSNQALTSIVQKVLSQKNITPHAITLLPSQREATAALLGAVGMVDLIIPRGSKGLIDYVRNNSRVPVIETGAGICHTYFHTQGDATKATAIINNAKTRRVSVCNALDCVLIDQSRVGDLPLLCAPLSHSNVVIYADAAAFSSLQNHYPDTLLKAATAESYGTEFLDYKMAIKTVANITEAIDHVTRYGSGHSETIVTEDPQAQQLYAQEIDAACVYCNVSTAFTDGAQFGLGAEIGISTQKLHARGPMGLHELTSYKYLIVGDGQIRA